MKTWWNILICMWIGVIHGEEHVNGDFSLTSSPLTATDGDLLTLTCMIRDESAVNIGWLQSNKFKFVTQQSIHCVKQTLVYGQDIISRINVSCNSTAHSIAFRFNSTTDQGSAWQCGKAVNESAIYPRSNIYSIGSRYMETTSADFETVTQRPAIEAILWLPIVVAGAVIIIIIITIGCCYRRCRKQVPASADTHTHDDLVVPVSQGKRKVAVVYLPSEDAVHQAEDNVVVGPGGSASGNDQQGPGLRINPVYVPTTVGDRIVTTGTLAGTGVIGGDNLHPETRGEYVALDRNAVQPSHIYEHLTTYEEIANM
ncbi:uncharacterized protein LOC124119004 [Haliotis rufescens]|uniref:uncharacterized protein LOC124119004 n=1 Tax=Haliotis rufescens TaxID=6454 RepID=UPI00201EE31D|nr:uncharacterized protein LOC124119004 [Haliotis rufescens]